MTYDDTQERIADAKNLFDNLYSNVHETKFSYVCTIDDKKFGNLYPFDISTADNRRAMAQKAIEINDLGHNVYFGVNCSDAPATVQSRGDSSKITLQTAVICDIDIDGGNHKTGKKKKLAKDFDEAKSFLPFDSSLLVHSGGGMHGYNIFDEPLRITDANRADAIARNKKFIEAIRIKAGKDYQIDGVGDLARVLRVPGTKNLKGDDAPLCYVVEVNPVRYSVDDFDAKLDGAFLKSEAKILQPIVKKLQSDYKKSTRTRFDDIFNSDDYNIFRAERMLDALKNVNHADLSYGRWLAINTACKNIGVPYDVVDAFNRSPNNGDNYNAEQNAKRWQQLNNTSFDIVTLHGIARDVADYSEKDSRLAYRKMYPDLFKRGGANNDSFSDNDYQKYFGDDATDLANAYRLENFCGSDVRWLTDSEQWLIYQNGIWTRGSEKSACLLPFAQKLYEFLSENAIDADAAKIANSFKQSNKVFSAISYLRGCDSIVITADDLDTHKNLLNCQNGVVDLTDGKFYPHVDKRAALITQQCRAAYYPDAKSELVEKFFVDIMPDEQTRAGLLRWLGYNLTGEVSEEKFIIWTGNGSNGKSTLSKTILYLLGNYAVTLPPTALLRNRLKPFDANAATTAINALELARYAISEEIPSNSELDSALIKNLTGGDAVPLRQLYREKRDVEPTFKLNLASNFNPKIDNIADYGVLRRILQMPFTVQFGGANGLPIDFNLKRKLIQPDALSALLALLAREAIKWYHGSGLIISPLMDDARANTLDESNFVADFIDTGEKFVRVPGASVKAKDFIDALKAEYPAECSRFKRADLIRLISSVGGVEYATGQNRYRVFKGIGKLGDDFDGEPLAPDDTPPPVD